MALDPMGKAYVNVIVGIIVFVVILIGTSYLVISNFVFDKDTKLNDMQIEFVDKGKQGQLFSDDLKLPFLECSTLNGDIFLVKGYFERNNKIVSSETNRIFEKKNCSFK